MEAAVGRACESGLSIPSFLAKEGRSPAASVAYARLGAVVDRVRHFCGMDNM